MNDVIKKMRRHLPKWEEVFANHTSDKRVGSRTWKECLQPNNKKAKNKDTPIFNDGIVELKVFVEM